MLRMPANVKDDDAATAADDDARPTALKSLVVEPVSGRVLGSNRPRGLVIVYQY